VRANSIRRLEGRMGWAEHVARKGEKWNAFRVLLETVHYGHIFLFNLLQTLCESTFLSNAPPNTRKNIAFFFNVPRLHPFVLPSSIETKLSMKHWWNDTDRGKPNFWNLSQFYLVRHESIMGWAGIEPGSTTDRLRHDRSLKTMFILQHYV